MKGQVISINKFKRLAQDNNSLESCSARIVFLQTWIKNFLHGVTNSTSIWSRPTLFFLFYRRFLLLLTTCHSLDSE